MNKNQWKTIVLIIFLILISNIGFSKKIAELPDVMKPNYIHILGNRMYIVEDISISIFSMPGFKLEKTFLRKGSGPQEITEPPIVTVLKDSLAVYSLGKLLIYSPLGEFKSEMRIIQPDIVKLFPIANNFVGTKFVSNHKDKTPTQYVCIFDKNLKTLRELLKSASLGTYGFFDTTSPKKPSLEMIKDNLDFFVYKDKVFIADTTRGLFFSVFDSNGNKLYEINTPYEKQKVTAAYRDKVMAEIKQSPRWNDYDYTFRDYFPPFKFVRFADDKIYLTSHPWKKDGCEMTVIDLKGKVLKKTTVPDTYLFTVDKDKFYYLLENSDTETWELHVLDIK